ncbi:hypothetical protein [Sorangium sp. So ce1335]|uniref:hypothetical protein n=1 Tax=Sorangium sp. So ce1335 TaxID=3133335 RepID=UPI003F60336B
MNPRDPSEKPSKNGDTPEQAQPAEEATPRPDEEPEAQAPTGVPARHKRLGTNPGAIIKIKR